MQLRDRVGTTPKQKKKHIQLERVSANDGILDPCLSFVRMANNPSNRHRTRARFCCAHTHNGEFE